MTLDQVTLSPPIMKISDDEPQRNVHFRGHPTKYKIQCKSFTENYKLGKLCYLSNSDVISEEELEALELIKEEGIYENQNNKSLFLIEDNEGKLMLLPSNIMHIIEGCKYRILDNFAYYRFMAQKNLYVEKDGDILYEFYHPVQNGKAFLLRIVVNKNNGKTVYEVWLSYTGLDNNDQENLKFEANCFQRFLENLPPISYYTSEIAVENYTLPEKYLSIRKKVNRRLYDELITYNEFRKFSQDNIVTIFG